MPDVLGGPRPEHPEPDPNLSKVSLSHMHTWWNDQGVRQETSCTCATGRNHTTPREGR